MRVNVIRERAVLAAMTADASVTVTYAPVILYLAPLPSLNVLLRTHWAKRRKLQRDVDLQILAGLGLYRERFWATWPRGKRVVHIERVGGKRMDLDNLTGAIGKLCLDGLRHAKLLDDDTPDHVTVMYAQRPVGDGERVGLRVSVRPE